MIYIHNCGKYVISVHLHCHAILSTLMQYLLPTCYIMDKYIYKKYNYTDLLYITKTTCYPDPKFDYKI